MEEKRLERVISCSTGMLAISNTITIILDINSKKDTHNHSKVRDYKQQNKGMKDLR